MGEIVLITAWADSKKLFEHTVDDRVDYCYITLLFIHRHLPITIHVYCCTTRHVYYVFCVALP